MGLVGFGFRQQHVKRGVPGHGAGVFRCSGRATMPGTPGLDPGSRLPDPRTAASDPGVEIGSGAYMSITMELGA
ncbi:hypothetical protein E2562_032261 [Oryza meyeriana var. granulata]|uniref:Uncharacterized protein n=1 Tax=Oryza meyeriana var. granulata TaxID=110450 RepID=A0A6G1F0E3_9ORYZ|nr:hypothetical protein E2562_032261 [Oryza meyeriana var. granulata]